MGYLPTSQDLTSVRVASIILSRIACPCPAPMLDKTADGGAARDTMARLLQTAGFGSRRWNKRRGTADQNRHGLGPANQ